MAIVVVKKRGMDGGGGNNNNNNNNLPKREQCLLLRESSSISHSKPFAPWRLGLTLRATRRSPLKRGVIIKFVLKFIIF